MRSKLLTALVIAAVMPLLGCSRRSRSTPSPAPEVQVESPAAGAVTVAPACTATRPPAQPAADSEALPATPTRVSGVPLAPLWADLDSALAELDSALAGLEEWELSVP